MKKINISYKVLANLIITIADLNLDYENNSIEDLLNFLQNDENNTISLRFKEELTWKLD